MEPQHNPTMSSDRPRSGSWPLIAGLLVLVCIIGLAMQLMLKHERQENRIKLAIAQVMNDSLRCRWALNKYLQSGDARELSSLNELHQVVIDELKSLKDTRDSSLEVKSDIDRLVAIQQEWNTGFAQRLISKRKEVDAGHATLADLQITYLQEDSPEWNQRFDNQFKELEEALHER